MKFHMKVRGFFKTALARQVAEAVLIRRRGGEGAILNSRGEFSRCYIPRLQVVDMEPQEGGDVDREHLTRRMREQDKDWEDTRMTELGSNAILGPTSSPRKRIKEQEEGAGAGIAKKKKRKLKHEVLQEGWGELPLRGGANK